MTLEERVSALERDIEMLRLELAEKTSAAWVYNALYLDRLLGVDTAGNATHPMLIDMTATAYAPDLPVPMP